MNEQSVLEQNEANHPADVVPENDKKFQDLMALPSEKFWETVADMSIKGNALVVLGKDKDWRVINPKKNCRKCHGRGWTGRETNTNKLMPCRCLARKINT